MDEAALIAFLGLVVVSVLLGEDWTKDAMKAKNPMVAVGMLVFMASMLILGLVGATLSMSGHKSILVKSFMCIGLWGGVFTLTGVLMGEIDKVLSRVAILSPRCTRNRRRLFMGLWFLALFALGSAAVITAGGFC